MRTALLLIVFLLASTDVGLSQWATLGSDHSRLKGKVIVDVGSIERQERVATDVRDLQPLEWWEFVGSTGRYCLDLLTFDYSYGEKAALLLVDGNETVYLAVIETVLTRTKVTVHSVLVIDCPSSF